MSLKIRADSNPPLTNAELVEVVSFFRSQLLPKRKAGRRPLIRITRAYEAWKAGTRGVALYRTHIPRWERPIAE